MEYSLRQGFVCPTEWDTLVLILILMEYSLRQGKASHSCERWRVLILILMEYSLRLLSLGMDGALQ